MTEPTKSAAPASTEPVAQKDAPVEPKQEPKAGDAQLSLLETVVKGDAGADVKPKEGESEGDGKPEKPDATPDLEIVLPEGVEADAEMIADFKLVAKEAGIDSKAASKLVAWDFARQKKFDESLTQSVKQLNEDWLKELKADKDFGGDKLKETLASASKFLHKYGGEEVAIQLGKLGVGNHPGLLKLMAKAGQALGEDDSFAKKAAANNALESEQQIKRQRYPSMFNADGSPKE